MLKSVLKRDWGIVRCQRLQQGVPTYNFIWLHHSAWHVANSNFSLGSRLFSCFLSLIIDVFQTIYSMLSCPLFLLVPPNFYSLSRATSFLSLVRKNRHLRNNKNRNQTNQDVAEQQYKKERAKGKAQETHIYGRHTNSHTRESHKSPKLEAVIHTQRIYKLEKNARLHYGTRNCHRCHCIHFVLALECWAWNPPLRVTCFTSETPLEKT